MSTHEVVPRLAPRPERVHKKEFDAVVLIPNMDEGLSVLRTLASVSRQREKGRKLKQEVAAVVVINQRPNARPFVYPSNMKAYTVLQALARGIPVDTKDAVLNSYVEEILKSGLYFEVIDAFSEGHAHPENNVGRARRIADERGLALLAEGKKPLSQKFVYTTDADSYYADEAFAAVTKKMNEEGASAGTLLTSTTNEGVDRASLMAYNNFWLYWQMRNALTACSELGDALDNHPLYIEGEVYENALERDLITFGGAYTVVRADMLAKVGGHDASLGYGEDTELGYKVVELGGKVLHIGKQDERAKVFTQQRISYRTDKGYGFTIGRFQETTQFVQDIQVEHPQVFEELDGFLSMFTSMEDLTDRPDAIEQLHRVAKDYDFDDATIAKLERHLKACAGVENSRGHQEFVRTAREYIEKRLGQVKLTEFADHLEKTNEQLSTIVMKELFHEIQGNDAFEVSWEDYKASASEPFERFTVTAQHPQENVALRLKQRILVASGYAKYIREVMVWLKSLMILKYEEAVVGADGYNFRSHIQAYPLKEPEDFTLITMLALGTVQSQTLKNFRNMASFKFSKNDLKVWHRIMKFQERFHGENAEKFQELLELHRPVGDKREKIKKLAQIGAKHL